MQYLRHGRFGKSRIVGLIQHPADALRQVPGIAFRRHIAVPAVIDHLGYASDTESHTRHAARHGLHDGVGKIVLERGQHEDIGGIVDVEYPLLVAHVTDGKDRQCQSSLQFLGVSAEDGDAGMLLHFRMLFRHPGYSLHEIVHPLALVRHTL